MRVKELENQGYEFEAAEASLALLIGKSLKKREECRSAWKRITSRCAAT